MIEAPAPASMSLLELVMFSAPLAFITLALAPPGDPNESIIRLSYGKNKKLTESRVVEVVCTAVERLLRLKVVARQTMLVYVPRRQCIAGDRRVVQSAQRGFQLLHDELLACLLGLLCNSDIYR